ncbi:P-loop containing nucleoside triphosphate hydrolase protein [Phialemonium atrogriseum]|uniref:P-loop containing nucleoside triphosphate hydrolase protein n=1 Tax=Phialemonium atrogriseum TaxID=1093897 RepID=A0AAJ0FKC7_9PEZI|nr:P-loop containing nucleoside triphosphate hydrolase protein [Phialemonium atrogriseum]KAK1763950.1 P-loop containing nucleoside triphosphate hydrolase protein [Phialemonium atrogriseum]
MDQNTHDDIPAMAPDTPAKDQNNPARGQNTPAISFGNDNKGLQVGQSYAPITAQIHLPPERPETPPKPSSTIPFRRDRDFINRGDLLEKIHQLCSIPAGRAALVGLGGVGKSQLAIEYAHRIRESAGDLEPSKSWVFWIHANTAARVQEGFKAIADAAKVRGRNEPKADILQLVYRWLCNEGNGRWYIILDSADDLDVFCDAKVTASGQALSTYLPQSQNGSILITTRYKEVAWKLAGDNRSIIEVGAMTQTDALSLLEKKLGAQPATDAAVELVAELDGMPLAISQAAAYIQQAKPRSSVEKYLEKFRKSERWKSSLLQHEVEDLRRDGYVSNSILKTWHISFDHIRSKRPSAADLLSLMSFFDRQGIPEWLLKPPEKDDRQEGGNNSSGDRGQGSAEGDESDTSADVAFEMAFDEDVLTLRNYSLVITTNEDGDVFEMHRLVQLSTRTWLKASGLLERFKRLYIARMQAFPEPDYSNWKTCQQLFPHIETAANNRPTDEESCLKWTSILYYGGWYAQTQGRYDLAGEMLKKAMATQETILGKGHESTLAAVSAYARVLSDKGLYKEAEVLATQVLEGTTKVLGVEHPETLTSMNNLALTYQDQGRWDEAEKLELQVLEIRKKVLGIDHPYTLTSMNNLASTYWKQGRWDEAEKLDVQVLEIRKRVLGIDHPDILTSMNNLALTYWNQGRWNEAEKLEVQVLEIGKRVLGIDHPDILTSMNNLASTYWNQGRWDEAEKLKVQVLEIRKRMHGIDHPYTLTSMNNLASTYWKQGRWDEAEKLDVQVLEIRKRMLGIDHPYTLTSMSNLAVTWYYQGRCQVAIDMMEDCFEGLQKTLGQNHAHTENSLAFLHHWKAEEKGKQNP